MKLKDWINLCTLAIAAIALMNTLWNNGTISNLQNTNNELLSKQTSAQETIAKLLDNQTTFQATIKQLLDNLTKAQEKIAELNENLTKIQNPTPTITIESVQPILIGPPPSSQITKFPNGLVSFQYNASLFLNMTILISTVHGGELTIPKGALLLYGYNMSEIWIGFSYSGISTMGYTEAFNPFTTAIFSFSVPLNMYYEFTNSHILQYSRYDLGYIGFSFDFTDLYTHSIYPQSSHASFQWNNSTSMP
jgi:hypothetical protein